MTNQIQRKIAIKDYYGIGKHVYEDQLGFRDNMKSEARSLVAREVFRYHVEEVGLNLGFYYPPTDTFYGILTEVRPVKVKTLPRDRRRSEVLHLFINIMTRYYSSKKSVSSLFTSYTFLTDTPRLYLII